MQLALLERPAEHFARTEQVLLAHDLVERARAHPVGERRARVASRGRLAEEIHYPLVRAASQAGRSARSVKCATGSTPQRARSAGFAR